MANTGRQITNLMMDTGKSATDMTHAVKVLGNGSMQKGFSRIGAFFSEEVATAAARGLAMGRVQGGVVGILGTASVGGIIAYVVNKKKKKDAHEAEGRVILRTMETGASTSDKQDESNYVEPENEDSAKLPENGTDTTE